MPAGRESSVNYERRCWTPQAAFMLVSEPYVEIRSWSDFVLHLASPEQRPPWFLEPILLLS